MRPLGLIALLASALVVIGFVGLPMAVRNTDGSQGGPLPFASRDVQGQANLLWFHTKDSNPVAGWSTWNYSGLQAKQATAVSGGWPEFQALVSTMAGLGQDPRHGCGRTMWEYAKDRLEGYGTPMAPMMLPYFTNGCIGSQEGLYFEASTTTPYHFLMQAELSFAGSNPQRDLPYPSFDTVNGVRHLQMMGVKYYAATTSQAVDGATANPDLTQVAVSGPWHIYQVKDAPTVEPLRYEPVVFSNVGQGQGQWLQPATAWFLDPARADVPLAIDGPASWKRVAYQPVKADVAKIVTYVRQQMSRSPVVGHLPAVPRRKLPAITVSNTQMGDDHLSFDVSRPGVPVVVKVSYFPNWEVSGADGPYRITPNLMVVIPRSTHVSMHFGRTGVDTGAIILTLLGLLGLFLLWWRPAIVVPPDQPSWVVRRWSGRSKGPGSADGTEAPVPGPESGPGPPDDPDLERWWVDEPQPAPEPEPETDPDHVAPVVVGPRPSAPMLPRTIGPAAEGPGA